jgi:hypothetical protein
MDKRVTLAGLGIAVAILAVSFAAEVFVDMDGLSAVVLPLGALALCLVVALKRGYLFFLMPLVVAVLSFLFAWPMLKLDGAVYLSAVPAFSLGVVGCVIGWAVAGRTSGEGVSQISVAAPVMLDDPATSAAPISAAPATPNQRKLPYSLLCVGAVVVVECCCVIADRFAGFSVGFLGNELIAVLLSFPLLLLAANMFVTAVRGFAYFTMPVILTVITILLYALLTSSGRGGTLETLLATITSVDALFFALLYLVPSILGLLLGLWMRHIRERRSKVDNHVVVMS